MILGCLNFLLFIFFKILFFTAVSYLFASPSHRLPLPKEFCVLFTVDLETTTQKKKKNIRSTDTKCMKNMQNGITSVIYQ